MKSAAEVLAGLREPSADEVLGLGEFAPKLTDEQEAARQRLMRDFLAVSEDHLLGDVAEAREAFGLTRGPTLDPIHARLASWATGGFDNTRRVGDVLYSWTAHPRLQQNGAGLGRVYSKKRGESPVDIGGYKLDAGGNILEFPDAARADFGVEIEFNQGSQK